MTRPFSKVYHEIVDDPQFARVYGNDHALATWLRMLLMADALYPMTAPLNRQSPSTRLLIEVGLIVEKPFGRYSVRGLEAERERRSDAGRNAAAVRWQSERNAEAMPSRGREEKRREEVSANAQTTNGSATFMGFKPKDITEQALGRHPKPGEHLGQHPDCIVCAPLAGRKETK